MDEVLEALDNNNYEQMYVNDTEVVEPKSKSITDYIKTTKHKIYKFFKYLFNK